MCECRSIVHAITDHRNLSFLLQIGDHSLLTIRKHTCDHFIDTCLLADCLSRLLVITGQHDNMDPHIFKLRDCFRAVLLHHIGNCHHSKDLAILREE